MATNAFNKSSVLILKHWLPIMMLATLMCITFMPTYSNGSGIKRRLNDDYHQVYARNAKPYATLIYDKTLPFVPRYRYPVGQHYGKRSDEMFYGNDMNSMYDEDGDWSPFLDAYSRDIAKRPFRLRG